MKTKAFGYLLGLLALVLFTGSVNALWLTPQVNSPGNSTWTTESTPSFNITCLGGTTQVNITLYLNGTSYNWSQVAHNTSEILLNLTNPTHNGSFVWNASCSAADGAGGGDIINWTANYQIYIDTVAPVVERFSPVNRTNTTDSTYDFSFNVTDNLGLLSGNSLNCTLYIAGVDRGNNASVHNSSSGVTITSTGMTEGWEVNWTVNCTDNATNTGYFENMSYISHDSTPPAVTFVAPTNNTALAIGTTEYWFNITTDENATCKFATSTGQSYLTVMTSFATTGLKSHKYLFKGLGVGSYDYYIKCNDTFRGTGGNTHNTTERWLHFTIAGRSTGGAGSSGSKTFVMPEEEEIPIVSPLLAAGGSITETIGQTPILLGMVILVGIVALLVTAGVVKIGAIPFLGKKKK